MGVDRLHQNVAIWGTPRPSQGVLVPNRNSQTDPANSGPKFVRNCREKIWAQKNGKEWKKGNSEFR